MHKLRPEIFRLLISHYGCVYSKLLNYLEQNTEMCKGISDTSYLIEGEVRYAIKEEMAQKLADVVFRRTTLAQAGNPTE